MARKWMAVLLAFVMFGAVGLPALADEPEPADASSGQEQAADDAAGATTGELSVEQSRGAPESKFPTFYYRSRPAAPAQTAAYYGAGLNSLGRGTNPKAIYDTLAGNAQQPGTGVYPVAGFTKVTGAPYTGRREAGVAPADAESVRAVQAAMDLAFSAFLADYPAVFWLESVTIRMTANKDYSEITGISLVIDENSLPGEYRASGWTEVRLDQTRLSTALSVFLEGLPAGGDTPRAELLGAVHDKLVREVRYDAAAAGSLVPGTPLENARPFSATGAFLDGEAVCDGYAKAFRLICDALGIPCLYVAGDGDNGKVSGPHAWNYVQMEDGAWYAVDTTWDDLDKSATVSRRYFLVGSSIQSDHTAYPGTFGSLPALSATDYKIQLPAGPAAPTTYYQVKSEYDDERGAVAVMPSRVSSGDSANVIVLPHKGYQVKGVFVDDKPQELAKEGGIFVLSNISKNIRLRAEFEPVVEQGPSASAVPPDGELDLRKLRNELADPTISGLLLIATDPFVLPATLLRAAREAGKPIEVVFRDAGQEFRYGWRFDGASITLPELEISLGLEVVPLKEQEPLHTLAGRDDGLVVTFEHGGLLPGPSQVGVRVATSYADGRTLYCYEYDPEEGKFVLRAQGLAVQNGQVTVPLERCAEYLLIGSPIEGAVVPEELAVPTEPVKPEVPSGAAPPEPDAGTANPHTGDSLPWAAPAMLGAALLALVLRRRCRE